MPYIQKFSIPNRWMIHSYYTLCPVAPDNSGRVLLAGADLKNRTGRIYIFNAEGEVVDEFAEQPTESAFYHTGFWQTWSPDAKYVYYQAGSRKFPKIIRRELATGRELTVDGDMEGAPPDGEPVVSALMGMIYAAGYGYGVYNPQIAPVPFENRAEHGIFEQSFDPSSKRLVLSVDDVLNEHPRCAELKELDRKLARKNNTPSGLTLMCYCVRWSPRADRMVFYFGNHCVDAARGEPRICNLFTCKRDYSDLQLALDMSNTHGVHWSWHPDGEHLIGYGQPADNDREDNCMAIVGHDGRGFRKLCSNRGSGHPSICPTDHNLLLTDTYDGSVVVYDIKNDRELYNEYYPNQFNFDANGTNSSVRNETRQCHHPVFTEDGDKILFNVLDGAFAAVYMMENRWRS